MDYFEVDWSRVPHHLTNYDTTQFKPNESDLHPCPNVHQFSRPINNNNKNQSSKYITRKKKKRYRYLTIIHNPLSEPLF